MSGFGSRNKGAVVKQSVSRAPKKSLHGSRHSFGGRYQASTPTAHKKKSGGGFLGDVGHFFSQTATDFKDVALGFPGAIKDLGSATYHDVKSVVQHPNSNLHHYKLTGIGEGVAKGIWEDFKHPLRHPGYTILDAIAIASTGAGAVSRVGAVGRLAKAAEVGDPLRASKVIKTLLKGPEPGRIAYKLPGSKGVVEKPAFKSALGRTGQRAFRDFLQSGAKGTRRHTFLEGRISKEIAREIRTSTVRASASGTKLLNVGKGLKQAEETALRVKAEGVPIKERIAFHQAKIKGVGSSLFKKRHEKQIRLLEAAQKYVTDGKPELKTKKLQEVYDHMKKVSVERENTLVRAGVFTPAQLARRVKQPAELMGHDSKWAEMYIPYTRGSRRASGEARVAGVTPALAEGGSIGVARRPSTAAFEGKNLHAANFQNKTTRALADSHLQASKYGEATRLRSVLEKFATDQPHNYSDWVLKLPKKNKKGQLVVTKLPEEIRSVLTKAEADLVEKGHPVDFSSLAGIKHDLRAQFLKPEYDPLALEKLAKEAHIKFVPEKIAKGLVRPHYRLESLSPTAAKLIDGINNSSRIAFLYLKPAYLVPNLVGNLVYHFIQAGFAAPKYLGRSVLAWRTWDKSTIAQMMNHVGEGAMKSAALDKGLGHFAVEKLARGWSKIVDEPIRFSALLYEGARVGIKTEEDWKKLLTDPTRGRKLAEVERRANDALVDYANLGPKEQEIVRRVVFFYPWIKGSTRRAGQIVIEHPVKTAAIGQLGRPSIEEMKKLGPLPSFMEGILPVGGTRHGNPLFINPQAASVSQTPVQIGEAIQGLFSGDPRAAAQFSQFATPAVGSAIQLATGYDIGLGRKLPANKRGLRGALESLFSSTPQYTLLKHEREGYNSKRLLPTDPKTAMMIYLFGSSIVPRELNRAAAKKWARFERSGF